MAAMLRQTPSNQQQYICDAKQPCNRFLEKHQNCHAGSEGPAIVNA